MAAYFDEVPAFGASVCARVHTSGQVLFAQGFQAVKIIVSRAKDRETAKNGTEEMAKGKKRFPGFEWLRMSPIKRRLFWLYSARGGIDEAKGLLFVASRRVTERDAASASLV